MAPRGNGVIFIIRFGMTNDVKPHGFSGMVLGTKDAKKKVE
jgi:hypothetical protein